MLSLPQFWKFRLSRTPMKRLGEPLVVARLVALLASDALRYITGVVITIDGGRMALNDAVPA